MLLELQAPGLLARLLDVEAYGAVVRDELTGETVAENAERFTLSADKPRVWFLGVR